MWLMDEPLAAVDLQTRIILQDELLRLWGDDGGRGAKRPTVLFVTHGIDEAVLLADRVHGAGAPSRTHQGDRRRRPAAAARGAAQLAGDGAPRSSMSGA